MATLSADVQRMRLENVDSSSGTTEDSFAQIAADRPGDILPFYEIEGQLLALWDQLNELKLEKSLLEARADRENIQEEHTLTNDEILKDLDLAQKECLEARAEYVLRESVIADAIVAGPILNAIHAGTNATATERTLRPLLDRRDILQVASTNLASSLQSIRGGTSQLAANTIAAMDRNRSLAAAVSGLAEKIKVQNEAVRRQPELHKRVEEVRIEAATAQDQWGIMKSVVAAVVAGSGIDWAQDDALRDLVLENDMKDR